MADLSEQLQKEKSHRERELTEAKEKHQLQIGDLQDKVIKLVGISGQCFCSITGFVNNIRPRDFWFIQLSCGIND